MDRTATMPAPSATTDFLLRAVRADQGSSSKGLDRVHVWNLLDLFQLYAPTQTGLTQTADGVCAVNEWHWPAPSLR
jgi:hypothetical protein